MVILDWFLVSSGVVRADFVFPVRNNGDFLVPAQLDKARRYKIYAEVHITITLPVSDRGWIAYRWYIALLQQKVFVISQNACIMDHNYGGGLHKHTSRYHRSHFDKLVHTAGSETPKTLTESSPSDQNFWVRCFGVDFTSLDLITAHTEEFVGNFDTKQYGTYSPTVDAVVQRCCKVQDVLYLKSGFVPRVSCTYP